MAKTIEQLKAQSAEIKNATSVGENTATRVGTLFNDIVDFEAEQIHTSRIADGAVTIEKVADSAIDDVPTAGSDNMAKSGGVKDESFSIILSSSEALDLVKNKIDIKDVSYSVVSGQHYNAYIFSDLKVYENQSYNANAIPVKAGNNYIIEGTTGVLGGNPVAIYSRYGKVGYTDNSKCSVIIPTEEYSGDYQYNILYKAEADGYIWVWSTNSNMLSVYNTELSLPNLKTENKNTIVNAINEIYDSLHNTIGTMVEKSTELSGTLFDGYYIYADLKIHSGLADAKCYRFQVEKYKTYILDGTTGVYGGNPVAIFNKFEQPGYTDASECILIIPTEDLSGEYGYNVQYTAPDNGYIWLWSYMSEHHLSVYNTVISLSYPFYPKKALKIQTFGDSITDDYWGDRHTWVTSMTNKLKSYIHATVQNSAVAATGLNHGYSNTGRYAEKQYNYLIDLLNDGTLDIDADIIIILVGTNDWSYHMEDVGHLGDTSLTTVYGCLKSIIEKICTDTNALLFLCTPCPRYGAGDEERAVNQYGVPINTEGVTLDEFSEAFRVSANFYGIPCIDLNHILGWNKMNVDNYTVDGLHPNNLGDDRIASIVTDYIIKHFR